MLEIFRFHPLYFERVWGGSALQSVLGRTLPSADHIGESWEIVDRPEAQSVVRSGASGGLTLREAIARDAAGIMGPGWPADRPFPLLVKWLDCRERLSLQVHPPAETAARRGGQPKTENWFIAETAPGAHLIAGLKKGVTRSQFEASVGSGTVEECVHRFPVAAGDSILVPSGRLHAIDAGSLILEIQQNSDTTWRVYDWGRVGLDGQPRRLHLAESMESIAWDDFEPAPVRAAPTSGVIAECPEFRIRRVLLGQGERLSVSAGEQPRILSVVAGRLHAGADTLVRGENVLLPHAGAFSFLAPDTAMILLTENFTG